MKTRIAALLAATFLLASVAACHRHHHAEGPVDKTKEIVKDVGHDAKETAKDIKNDIKR